MIELRNEVKGILETYHKSVYFQKASKGAKFPYVVYDFPNSFTNDDQEIFNFDVDIWDNNQDSTQLETLASDLWRGLNKLRYLDENIQFSIYRDNRLPPLDEESTNIKRRKLIFQLRYYDRNL